MNDMLQTKPLDLLMAESREEGTHSLRRVLGPVNLVTLGIGAIIGAGIFVLTGTVSAQFTGPAIVLSFILAGFGCLFAGLCYAEFASLIPIAGSAYTYGYATLGEIFAWIIGWDLIIEYAVGAAMVARGWSGNLVALLQGFGYNLPPQLTATPGALLVFFQGRWVDPSTIAGALAKAGADPATLPRAHGILDLPAYLVIAIITAILVIGVRESANFNTTVVFIKVATVLVFIGVAALFLLHHPEVSAKNWHPFIPKNTGEFGHFGLSGIARGAGVIFFAYIGFDAVSTAAQEAKNPQRDMPIGILGSLAICTVLYIALGGLLTGVVSYTELNTAAPVALGIDATGVRWGSVVVKLGTFAGLTTTMLVMLLGQSRVFYSMAHDGLLPEWAGRLHPRFRTPWISSIAVGFCVALFASLMPIDVLSQLTSIGTLLAFVIVSAGVWVLRVKRPDLPRPFKTPLVPLVPILGIGIALGLMASLTLATWIRLIVWLVIGMAIYFGYSRSHSRLRKIQPGAK
ncbi:MAG TPA: amino acid permease [Candidatus Acidoferrales bacterium]|jgi:APA family basic amino acid/polyamine antiporter|nr:amino acid permease [Candidatus Acidoferrales bacterium]